MVQFAPGNNRGFDPYYAGGKQQQINPYAQQGWRAAGFGAATAGLGLGLYGAHRMGYRPMDYLYSAARTIEDFSPGQVFRTFGAGDFLSQFTSANRQLRFIRPEVVSGLENTAWFDDLLRRTGPELFQGLTYGLTFRGGTLYTGAQQNLPLLRNAAIISSSGRPNIAAAYARGTGFRGLPGVRDAGKLELPIEYLTRGGSLREEVFYLTGASTRLGATANQTKALLTEWVQRANRLAESPFEMEPFETVTSKGRDLIRKYLRFDPSLSVKSYGAMETLGRMGVKWGLVGTAAYLGYQSLDYYTRQSSIFDNTIFSEGITAGIATIGVKANLAIASVADAVPGVRSYQEWQEGVAPGSTSLTKLSALPLAGALGGLTGAYLTTIYDRAKATRQFMGQGLSYGEALTRADKVVREEADKFASETFDWLTRGKFKGRRVPLIGRFGKAKQFGFMGAMAGGLLTLPFIPGALIPEKSAGELRKIYSGEQEVAVRKGRWWEFGRSPYEGGRIEYFRPHWYPRLLQDSINKSLGTEDTPPWKQWFIENFTYEMEERHYYERPYPVTGTAFEDIPIFGPLLSATFGRLIKPPQYMHPGEWMGPEGEGVLRIQERFGDNINPALGDTPQGTPVNTTDIQQAVGEQMYRLTELSGLVGFTLSSIKGAITGSDEFFDQEERLQNARRSYGAERAYWDLSLGGGLGTTEFFRRLYPHRRRQIEEYNPIRNTMPEWLPGPGEKSPDFLHGDPFIKVAEGELRLPGPGYAARFPELEGVAPKDYPAIHRYKILADVAPYSEAAKKAQIEVRRLRKNGKLSKREEEMYTEVQRQIKAKRKRKSFYEYEYFDAEEDWMIPGEAGADQSKNVLAQINAANADEEDRGIAATAMGVYWESLIKAAQNPLEALTPLAPASKGMHLQSAIEDYERTQAFGPDIAFWDQPVENFILPFLREAGLFFGMDVDVPEAEVRERQIEEYFDILEYIKNKRLEKIADEEGLTKTADKYRQAAKETLTGVNPYSRDYTTMFRAMPRAERDYFNAFSSAKNIEDRQRILELIPAAERRLYVGQWEVKYADQIKKMMDKGLLDDEVREEARAELERIWAKKHTEGYPVNEELREQYEDERAEDESYAEWFRRQVLIPEVVAETGLPGPDWVGWHPGVNLDDIKLKVVKNEGLDIHDFNLWQSDEKRVAHREFIEEAASEIIETDIEREEMTEDEMREEVMGILDELGIAGQVHVYGLLSGGETNTYKLLVDISEDREKEVRSRLEEAFI